MQPAFFWLAMVWGLVMVLILLPACQSNEGGNAAYGEKENGCNYEGDKRV